MLMPKRMKYRKMHRGVGKGTRIAGRGTTVAFGDVGLMALDSSWVNSRQIEAARRAITNYVNGRYRVYVPGYSQTFLLPPGSGIGILCHAATTWTPEGSVTTQSMRGFR